MFLSVVSTGGRGRAFLQFSDLDCQKLRIGLQVRPLMLC